MDETRDTNLAEGTKWMLDLGVINNEYMVNVITANIYACSFWIKSVGIVSDMYSKKLLVFISLGWIGRVFFMNSIMKTVKTRLLSGLPEFSIRVTTDRAIYEKSVNLSAKILNQRRLVTRS